MIYAVRANGELQLIKRGDEPTFRFFAAPSQFELLDMVPAARTYRLQTGSVFAAGFTLISFEERIGLVDALAPHEGGWRDVTSDDWVIKNSLGAGGKYDPESMQEHTGVELLRDVIGFPPEQAAKFVMSIIDPRWYGGPKETQGDAVAVNEAMRSMPGLSALYDVAGLPLEDKWNRAEMLVDVVRDLRAYTMTRWFNELEPDHAVDINIETEELRAYVEAHVAH